MSTDTQDMLTRLQLAAAQQNQPAFAGIQAPTDPAAMQNILSQLQNNMAVQQAGNTGNDQYSFLRNAGAKDFQRAANSFGSAGQQAANVINGSDPDAAGTQQAQLQKNAILAAKAVEAKQLASGADPLTAQSAGLQVLQNAGLDVSAAMAKNQEDAQKVATGAADAGKADAAGKASLDEMEHRTRADDRALAAGTWHDISHTSDYTVQRNDLGETRSTKTADKQPVPLSPSQDGALDALAKHVAAGEVSLQDAFGRGANMTTRADFLARVYAVKPDFTPQDYKTSQAMLTAYGSGAQGQQTLKLQNAINHLDLLRQAGVALDNKDLPALNKIALFLKTNTGSTPIAAYDAIAPIVANEVSGAIIKGGGGEEERLTRVKALSSGAAQPQREAAIGAMRGILGAQYANSEKQYASFTKRSDFQDHYPIAGGLPAPGGGTVGGAGNTTPQGATQQQAPPSAIDFLKANPGAAAQFKAKFGYLPQ